MLRPGTCLMQIPGRAAWESGPSIRRLSQIGSAACLACDGLELSLQCEPLSPDFFNLRDSYKCAWIYSVDQLLGGKQLAGRNDAENTLLLFPRTSGLDQNHRNASLKFRQQLLPDPVKMCRHDKKLDLRLAQQHDLIEDDCLHDEKDNTVEDLLWLGKESLSS